MKRSFSLALLLVAVLFVAVLFGRVLGAAEHKPVWLAVVRSELAEPLKALADKRRSDGFDVIVSTKPIAEAIKEAISSIRRPDYLLLVGDDEPGQEAANWYLPAKRIRLYRWRGVQALGYACDAAWGDLDGDGLPDIPVGRIPARNRGQVDIMAQKILAFENQAPTAADLQLPVWLGSPEYTPTINAMASGLGVTMIRTKGPSWLRPWFISGNPNDLFCGVPSDQPGEFTAQMKRGGIMGVLMGHANAKAFYSMNSNGQPVYYTAADAASVFGKGQPVPPMIFFSCETGKFASARSCQAKALLMMPGGPVATIGATTESHPLPNYFTSACLLTELGGKENRLGPIWFRAQRAALHTHDTIMEMMLADAEGSLEKQINVEKLRHDQMLMYELLGDPATKLRLPERLQVKLEHSGNTWRWQAVKPPRLTHLDIGFRSASPQFVAQNSKGGADAARKAFAAANAGFDFTPLPSPMVSEAWQGTYDKPGWLRLVASGPGTFSVAVVKLE